MTENEQQKIFFLSRTDSKTPQTNKNEMIIMKKKCECMCVVIYASSFSHSLSPSPDA
jgi:hypothetical protein